MSTVAPNSHGVRREVVHEAALADARLSGDDDDLAAATADGLQLLVEDTALGQAADERVHASPRRARPQRTREQHRGLGLTQVVARFDTELVGQQPARPLEGLQRVGPPPGPPEGADEPGPPVFAERGLADEAVEQCDEPVQRAAALEHGREEVLGLALLLFEPQCHVRDERRVGEIGERVPAPQRERTFEDARRDLGPVERGRVPGSVDQRRELAHVEAARAGRGAGSRRRCGAGPNRTVPRCGATG